MGITASNLSFGEVNRRFYGRKLRFTAPLTRRRKTKFPTVKPPIYLPKYPIWMQLSPNSILNDVVSHMPFPSKFNMYDFVVCVHISFLFKVSRFVLTCCSVHMLIDVILMFHMLFPSKVNSHIVCMILLFVFTYRSFSKLVGLFLHVVLFICW